MGLLLKLRSTAVLIAACLALSCAATRPTPNDASLVTRQGDQQPYHDVIARARFTVFVFVSATCPCLTAHDPRLQALFRRYSPRGVQFLGVDSEVGTSPAVAAREARAISFPVLLDRGAKLADAFGAEYATYVTIVDRQGHVMYRGGIDSDKRKLHPDRTPYVRDALDDLLAGRRPRRAFGKTLGCTLRKW